MHLGDRVAHELEEDLPQGPDLALILQSSQPAFHLAGIAIPEHLQASKIKVKPPEPWAARPSIEAGSPLSELTTSLLHAKITARTHIWMFAAFSLKPLSMPLPPPTRPHRPLPLA